MNPRALLISSLGLGYLRPAPGTWGSLPPPALAFLLVLLSASNTTINLAMLALCVLGSVVCLAFGGWAELHFNKKDASYIVADETAGQAIPLMLLPAAALETPTRAFLTFSAAFLLFRILDIIKPPPAHQLQRLPKGLGVLIDDLIAGLYAAIILQLALHFLILPLLAPSA